MTRYFTVCFLCLMALLTPTTSWGNINDRALTRAENYLSGLTTLKSRFTQVTPDGNTIAGNFYLKRPGKLRFEYDDPIKDFIVADGTFIFYYDSELKQQSNTLIGQTLADFILRKDVNLSDDVDVTEVSSRNGLVMITLVQKEDPYAGSLSLGFSPDPFELQEWTIIDPQGLRTRIILEDIKRDISLKGVKFYYQDPDHGKTPTYNE